VALGYKRIMDSPRPKSYAHDSYRQKSQARRPEYRSWLSYIVGMDGRPVIDEVRGAEGKSDRLDKVIRALLARGR